MMLAALDLPNAEMTGSWPWSGMLHRLYKGRHNMTSNTLKLNTTQQRFRFVAGWDFQPESERFRVLQQIGETESDVYKTYDLVVLPREIHEALNLWVSEGK